MGQHGQLLVLHPFETKTIEIASRKGVDTVDPFIPLLHLVQQHIERVHSQNGRKMIN